MTNEELNNNFIARTVCNWIIHNYDLVGFSTATEHNDSAVDYFIVTNDEKDKNVNTFIEIFQDLFSKWFTKPILSPYLGFYIIKIKYKQKFNKLELEALCKIMGIKI